ncbi:unnamed protein product, partial [Gongylonema pulchrum]|uniref:Uncharacterized protein n=1 Tax=Gongylonema pulchrum TaxID=637853 RepID=A0A183EWX4_9BILA
MSSDSISASKNSPFLSLFSRKKRINNMKAPDEIKGSPTALPVHSGNGQVSTNVTTSGGYIDSENS